MGIKQFPRSPYPVYADVAICECEPSTVKSAQLFVCNRQTTSSLSGLLNVYYLNHDIYLLAVKKVLQNCNMSKKCL